MLELPRNEAETIVELAAFVDARPVDEVVSDGRHHASEREGRGAE